MIDLQGVCRVYEMAGKPVAALRDVSEHILPGEYVAIIGPSGSGKSTLLNILGCLDRPTSGTYRLRGEEAGQLGEGELVKIRRHLIGFVFQFFHLVPRLTALQNVELPLVFAGVPRAERRRRAREALESVELAGREDHRPDELSGGERQRVAVARATVTQPALLLADEPTGNLDSAAGAGIIKLLEERRSAGATLVVVTHDGNLARRADRLLVMRDGRVLGRMP